MYENDSEDSDDNVVSGKSRNKTILNDDNENIATSNVKKPKTVSNLKEMIKVRLA